MVFYSCYIFPSPVLFPSTVATVLTVCKISPFVMFIMGLANWNAHSIKAKVFFLSFAH